MSVHCSVRKATAACCLCVKVQADVSSALCSLSFVVCFWGLKVAVIDLDRFYFLLLKWFLSRDTST